MLDKPIFLCFSDFLEYSASRGFNTDMDWGDFSKNRCNHFGELLDAMSNQFEYNSLEGNVSNGAKFKFHEVCNEQVLHQFLVKNVFDQ